MTDNIQVIAISYPVVSEGAPVFQYLFVPTYFKRRLRQNSGGFWPDIVKRGVILLRNLKRLIVVFTSAPDVSIRELNRVYIIREMEGMVETKGIGAQLMIIVSNVHELESGIL